MFATLIEKYECREFTRLRSRPCGNAGKIDQNERRQAGRCSKVTGIPTATLSNVLARRRGVRKQNIFKLGEYFGLSPIVFLLERQPRKNCLSVEGISRQHAINPRCWKSQIDCQPRALLTGSGIARPAAGGTSRCTRSVPRRHRRAIQVGLGLLSGLCSMITSMSVMGSHRPEGLSERSSGRRWAPRHPPWRSCLRKSGFTCGGGGGGVGLVSRRSALAAVPGLAAPDLPSEYTKSLASLWPFSAHFRNGSSPQ